MPLVTGKSSPEIVMAGAVAKVTPPVTLNGAIVLLGVSAPKLNCKPELMPALFTVRLEQVHCWEADVTETPSAALFPGVAATVTALLELEPPATPSKMPALTVVAPL